MLKKQRIEQKNGQKTKSSNSTSEASFAVPSLEKNRSMSYSSLVLATSENDEEIERKNH
jgi:hypothetical protein